MRLHPRGAGLAAWGGLRVALRTAWWLLLIMIPTAFATLLLDLFGILGIIASALDPLMGLVRLPGEAALILVTGALVSMYPAIAVMTAVGLSGHQVTVMALMLLLCHNLIVETTVQVRVGSRAWRILLLRIGGAFLVGVLMSRRLGISAPGADTRGVAAALTVPSWDVVAAALRSWVHSMTELSLRVLVIVVVLMVGQRLLEYWGVLRKISDRFAPLVALFGLPPATSFLWIVANTLGLTYGAAVIVEERNAGRVSPREADLLNHHLAISHSLLEDTLLFVAIGVAPLVLIVPRLTFAFLVVWGYRLALRANAYLATVRRA